MLDPIYACFYATNSASLSIVHGAYKTFLEWHQ